MINISKEINLIYHLPFAANRVSVQGVKPLVGHFACLSREFDCYEEKKNQKIKKKGKYFYTFNH
jgi:hypothetical protein